MGLTASKHKNSKNPDFELMSVLSKQRVGDTYVDRGTEIKNILGKPVSDILCEYSSGMSSCVRRSFIIPDGEHYTVYFIDENRLIILVQTISSDHMFNLIGRLD